MLLLIYIIIALTFLAFFLYKYNKGKYEIYFITALITSLLGLIAEEKCTLANKWTWNESFFFLFGAPIEILIVYAIMGFAGAVLVIHFKDKYRIKPSKKIARFSLPILLAGLISSIILINLDGSITPILFFIGLYFYLKYQHPIIIVIGAISAIIEIVFDYLLIIFNGLQYQVALPFLPFFAIGMSLSGLVFFFDEIFSKIKKK